MISTSISVRTLVEFILRSGDIDNRFGSFSDESMSEGIRIHKMIQKRAGADYRAEVPLACLYKEDDVEITVEGRADGIIENDSGVTVDEIKSTYADVMNFKEGKPLHLAQAKFYAYMLMKERELPVVKIRLTYVNIDTEEVRYFNYEFLAEELTAFVEEICHSYVKWARMEAEWIEKRNDSIRGLPFPFEYRKGQDDLVKQVYFTIHKKKKLFLEAPTGVGKTISTVYPAIQAMGNGEAAKIFYLTAKTITRTVADDTVNILRNEGLNAKSIILTAKEKICVTGECECNPENCPYAKGHFDRINDALFDILTNEVAYSREKIEEYAEKHQVCPFEFGLDVSLFSDVIICDYNYAFDPRAKLKRFFETASDKYIFLIDEAHNLVDRAREMYSASIVKEDLLTVKRTVEDELPKIAKKIDKCNKALLDMKHDCSEYLIDPPIDKVVETLLKLYSEIEKYFEEERKSRTSKDKSVPAISKESKEMVLNLYFEVGAFLEIYELLDENYTVYAAYNEYGDFYLKLFCVNPRKNLMECMDNAISSILFSATFLPVQYYKKLLGGKNDDYEVYAQSVFNPEKKALLIARDVTSKYTRRSDSEYSKIAGYIHETVLAKEGNYMAFFPSYSFMEKVYDAYVGEFGKDEGIELLVQSLGMKEKEKEDFIDRFKRGTQSNIIDEALKTLDFEVESEDDCSTLLGFCVLGGIFSEGIDLKNDSLIGAIIVGTGLPQVCLEREIMKASFDESEEDGFDYSYRYPGMNKVLQAAGRVIRTVEDIGVVVLLDERFLQNSYLRMFPREWQEYSVVDLKNIGEKLENFWESWGKY